MDWNYKVHRKVQLGVGTKLHIFHDKFLNAKSRLPLTTKFPHLSIIIIPQILFCLPITKLYGQKQESPSLFPLALKEGILSFWQVTCCLLFLLLCAWTFSKAVSPHFHLRPGIPQVRCRSEPLCEIWLVCSLLPQGNGSNNKGVPTDR